MTAIKTTGRRKEKRPACEPSMPPWSFCATDSIIYLTDANRHTIGQIWIGPDARHGKANAEFICRLVNRELGCTPKCGECGGDGIGVDWGAIAPSACGSCGGTGRILPAPKRKGGG